MSEQTPPDLVYPRGRVTELRRLPLKLRIGSFVAEFLGWGFIDHGWWRNYLHLHTYYEICYVFRGQGAFRMLGTKHPVKKGDVFIAKPGEEHEIISGRKDPMGIYFWSYTLLPDSGSHTDADEAIDRLLHAFVESRSWVSARAPGMERTLELLTEEIVRREPGYLGVVEGLTRKLILDTARAALEKPMPGEEAPSTTKDPQDAIIEQAMRYIRDNYSRDLSVANIAAQVNLSERHFSRLFRRKVGRSPLQSLTESRMDAAAQLLLDAGTPIKEVAQRAGYPDVRYFTTVFRRYHGITPARFRASGGTQFKAGPRAGKRKKRII